MLPADEIRRRYEEIRAAAELIRQVLEGALGQDDEAADTDARPA